MFATHLECSQCARPESLGRLATVCPACSMPLVVRYDLARVREAVSCAEMERRRGGLWAFRELLPVPEHSARVSLGEGGTPLFELPRLAGALGLARLLLKDESANPTGSFKARGMSIAVTMAKLLGARELAAPSAGNAGGALAAYGARAGLPVHLAMPRDVPLANRIEAEICGAELTLLDGTIADCGRWIRERCAEHGWFDLSTLKEPYRVEGKKTMGFELARDGGWKLPDVILYPTGGGTGLVGLWKAFEELRELGWLESAAHFPRLVAVQARGCAPIVEAFHAGAERATPPALPATCAAGLRVPAPIGDRWMLRVLRASAGTAVAVEDAALLAATRRLAASEGLFVAPEAGALVAALEELLAQGWIDRAEEVVLLSTGTGLKYLECF